MLFVREKNSSYQICGLGKEQGFYFTKYRGLSKPPGQRGTKKHPLINCDINNYKANG